MTRIEGRLGVIQRVLPAYRAAFFELLAQACPDGLEVFAGRPRAEEAIQTRERLEGARVARAWNIHLLRGRGYLCWQRGLAGWLRVWQPEALIVEANPRYLSTPGAVRWMRARGRPVIGWGLGAPGGGLADVARRRFLAQFDALITYSQQGASEYARVGFPAGRIFVAPNAAVRRPQNGLPERGPAPAAGEAVVLFVGRLQPRKRVDLLLEACAAQPEGARPRLWVVGDGPARLQLETLARRVYPRAQFFGARQGAELDELFREADLFALPGTGGLAVQQAMAHGLPVLVGEADGTQGDLVRAGNGRLLPAGDGPALAQALGEMLADGRGLRQMGKESHRIVAEEINLERMAAVFVEAVKTVCTSS